MLIYPLNLLALLFRWSFENKTVKSLDDVSKRLENFLVNCRRDESNVKKEMIEMIDIIKKQLQPSKTAVAKGLLSFLEDKYDTKMWIVIVRHVTGHFIREEGFHKVQVGDIIALAISVSRADANDLGKLASHFLTNFELPKKTTRMQNILDDINPNAYPLAVKEYVNRYLESMRTRVDAATLIISSNTPKEEKINSYVIEASKGAPYVTRNQTKYSLLVVIVPVKPSVMFNSSFTAALNSITDEQNQCRWNSEIQHSGPLRNYNKDLYLSTDKRGYTIVNYWKNSSSQRWRFVDNQLRNDNGKCLTAWAKSSWYLYEDDCHNNWPGQTWTLNGLQIINGYNLCFVQLQYYKHYMVQDGCSLVDNEQRSELWLDFHTDCTNNLKIPAEHIDNDYRLLRKKESKDYLTATKNDVFMSPWINDPGQYWKLVDGKLINGYEKCLIFSDDSWRVEQIDCNEISNGHKLTYNDNNQIVNDKGYCLTISLPEHVYFDYPDRYDYYHCSDVSKQRWIFEI